MLMTFVATGGRKHLAMQRSFLLLSHGAFMVQVFLPSSKTTKITSNLRIRQLSQCFFLSDKDVFGCLWSIPLHLSSCFWLCTAYSCSVGHQDHTTGVTKQGQKWGMTPQSSEELHSLAPCRTPMPHKVMHSHTAELWKRVGKENGWVL